MRNLAVSIGVYELVLSTMRFDCRQKFSAIAVRFFLTWVEAIFDSSLRLEWRVAALLRVSHLPL